MPDITGTPNNDDIVTSVNGAIVHGLGGHDYIRSNGRDSEIYGDAGEDTIVAYPASGSTLLLDGGADNDNIIFDTPSDTMAVTIRGGRGNDRIETRGGGTISVDAGDGDDNLILGVMRDAGNGLIPHTVFNVALGSGSDRVALTLSSFSGQANLQDIVTFTDFGTGNAGDRR